MSDKVVTIVTPSFNQAQFIGETIASVMSQAGNFYLDYIIADGGSQDNSVEVIKQAEQRLQQNSETKEVEGLKFYIPREGSPIRCLGISFRWISEPDRGQPHGVNKGIEMARGDIFGYLNSDDVLEPFALQGVVTAFDENSEADVIYGNALYINPKGKITGMYPVEEFSLQRLYENCFISQASTFVKMSKVQEVGGFNENIANSLDYEYWLRLAKSGAQFKFIRNVLSSTRIHQDAKTARNQQTIKYEAMALAKHYSGEVPGAWKLAFTRDVSFLSKFINVAIAIDRKVGLFLVRLYTPIYFVFHQHKVAEMERKIFSEKSK